MASKLSLVLGELKRRKITRGVVASFPLLGPLSGCTTFATPRSAEVRPGNQFSVQAALGSPPGDEAAWFWSFDCATDCNHAVGGVDLNFTRGWVKEDGRGFTFGGGLNGTQPYVEGFLQLKSGPQDPLGVGGRLGLMFGAGTNTESSSGTIGSSHRGHVC